MSERTYRLVQAIYTFIALILGSEEALYGLMIVYALEALTNLRVPFLISVLRYGRDNVARLQPAPNCRIKIDAERVQRGLLAVFLYVTVILFPEEAWFGPWFMGFILLVSGLTNVCVSVVFLRHLGFR